MDQQTVPSQTCPHASGDTPMIERDYFTDHEILRDPYAYFEALREASPVYRDPKSGIVFVTGFEEVLEVLKNGEAFSSAICTGGPQVPLPFTPEGDDLTPQIEAHRTELHGGDLLVALDDRRHAMSRALLMKLFTPSKLRANEEFMTNYADEIVRAFVAKGGGDMIREIATPFVTVVIADLLGVPADDRQLFMEAIAAGVGAGSLNPEDLEQQNAPLVLMGMYFNTYVADRRANPRDDVLSELSNATYPDGTMPDEEEIVRLTIFLFGAGQDTSAKLLGNTLKFMVEDPSLEAAMRADPSIIPDVLEEVLRLEGSTKMTSRLARHPTKIGDMDIPAGTKVFLGLAAANRDPRRWEDPKAFIVGRPKNKEHLGFGRGPHVCAGMPIARFEVKILIEKLLEHTSSIKLDEAIHGPVTNSNLEYEPSFIIRGLSELNLKVTPSAGFVAPDAPASEEQAVEEGKKRGFMGFIGRRRGKAAIIEGDVTGFTTATSRIKELLADDGARAVIDKHFPGMSSDPRIGMAKSMTLRMIQKFAPTQFTAEALDAVDADLAALPKN